MLRHSREFAEFLKQDLTQANRDTLEFLLLIHFGPPRQVLITALLDFIFLPGSAAPVTTGLAIPDRFFMDALIGLVQACPLTNRPAPVPARQQNLGRDFDFLYGIRDDPEWGLPRCLNFLYRRSLNPFKKIAIVTTIRNEGINLIEWIAHHRLLGIDDFIIYANDNDDGSSDLLNLLAAHGIVHIIWNDTEIGKADAKNMFPIQAKCFCHASEFLLESRGFEFLLFMDVDEFLITRPVFETPGMDRPLDDLFARIAAASPDAIAFNWKWFTGGYEFDRRPGLNFARFPFFSANEHVKTMARSDLCVGFPTSHMPDLPFGSTVLNGALQPASPGFKMPPRYEYGQMNHYWSKSFEEFIGKNERSWGKRGLQAFFGVPGETRLGTPESVPLRWRTRLHGEIHKLQALPGIAAELVKIDRHYATMLAIFDQAHDAKALYRQYMPPG